MGGEGNCLGSGLQPNDMILAVNGKLTGGMTEECFQIELAVSGQDLLLLISRYKYPLEIRSNEKQQEISMLREIDAAMNDERLLHWTHQGANHGGAVKTNHPLRCPDEDKETSNQDRLQPKPPADNRELPSSEPALKEKPTQRTMECSQSKNQVNRNGTDHMDFTGDVVGCNDDDLRSCDHVEDDARSRSSSAISDDSNTLGSQEEEEEDDTSQEDDDGCAWMGCVCGKIHRKGDFFWIQCDCCKSWYNPATRCIGFDRSHAESLPGWLCPVCGAEESSVSSKSKNREANQDTKDVVAATNKGKQDDANAESINQEAIVEETEIETNKNAGDDQSYQPKEKPPFGQGDIVQIREHAWCRVNNPEGVAWILRAFVDNDGDQCYDIKYVIGGDRRFGVSAEYVRKPCF